MARFDRRAVTMATFIVHVQFEGSLVAKDRFFECHRDGCFNITTALRLLRSAATTKKLIENIAKAAAVTKIKMDILTAESAKTFERIAATTAIAIAADARMSELIVTLAF